MDRSASNRSTARSIRSAAEPTSGTASSEGAARLRLATIARRRPKGRALLGGLLVAIAGTIAFTAVAGAGTARGRSAVVAARAIPIGHRLTESDLTVRHVETDANDAQLWSSPSELVGAIAISPIGDGEFLQPSAISLDRGAASSPEVTITVERDHALGGDVRPGESVDLLATYGTGNDAITITIAHRARVLRIDELRGTAMSTTGRLLVTLAMSDPDQVLDATHAGNVATVTLVRTTGVDGPPSARNSTTGPLARAGVAR